MTLSLRELLLIFVAVGVGLAALIKGSAWSASLLMLAALLAWTAFAIATLATQGRTRWFAVGFVVSCAAFACANCGSQIAFSEPLFPSNTVVAQCHSLFADDSSEEDQTIGGWPYVYYSGSYTGTQSLVPPTASVLMPNGTVQTTMLPTVAGTPTFANFRTTCHALLAMLLGYIGGKFGALLFSKQHSVERSKSS